MSWEITFIKWLQSSASSFSNTIAEFITNFGEQYILIVILAFIYFAYDKKVGEQIAYCTFIGVVSNNAIKGLVKAPRPFTVAPEILDDIPEAALESATGYSFPSGHTQSGSTFYSAIGFHFKKRWVWIVVIIAILLVGFSRIYLGVHFPKDVIVGTVLGFGGAWLGTFLYQKWGQSYRSKLILFLATAAVFLPFIFIFYRPDFDDIEIYRDFYTSYSLMLGFIGAVAVENKWVNFTCNTTLKRRLIRFALGLVVLIGVLLGLDKVFPEGYIFLDMLRYALVSFIGMGLYPFLFKPLHLD